MTFRPAPGVAWLLDPEPRRENPDAGSIVVVAARLPDGDPVALQGPAATIWLAALDAADEDSVVTLVSQEQGVPVERSESDTRRFLAELLERGLLVTD